MRDIEADFEQWFGNGDSAENKARAPKPYEDIYPFPDEWTTDYAKRHGLSKEEQGKGQLLYKYCDRLLWGSGLSEEDERRIFEQKIQDAFGIEKADELITKARAWAEPAIALLEAYKKSRAEDLEIWKKIRLVGGPLIYKAKNAVEYFERKKNQSKLVQVYKSHGGMSALGKAMHRPAGTQGKAETSFKLREGRSVPETFAAHPNDISRLEPSREWTMYVDESGKEFESGGNGVLACVLCDQTREPRLAPCGKMHACEETEEGLERGNELIRAIRETPNTGVLALPISALHAADEWSSDLAAFLTLVLRMIPLDASSEVTRISVYVENRAPYTKNEDFIFLRDVCRAMLLQVAPERAKRLTVDVLAMKKGDSFDAYPDYVANVCFAGRYARNEIAHDRLSWTGWDGTCFLNYPSSTVGDILQCFLSYRQLRLDDWDRLVLDTDTSKEPMNLMAALLDSYGEEARRNRDIWVGYLEHVVRHLESKAISMRLLTRQIEWLERYKPATEALPPSLRLMWLTSRIATANHRGEPVMESLDEFNHLTELLFEEDASLVTDAILHLAVSYTNMFRFAEAKDLLEDLIERIKGGAEHFTANMFAIPGRKYAAQLISSYGQHLAFLGNYKDAEECFERAIELFGRLSDAEEGRREISQTRAYLLTVLMDDASADDEKLRKVAEAYFGSFAQDWVKDLARTTKPALKYAAHLLVRYIVSGRAPEGMREKYLKYRMNWGFADGHPWELTDFYRALLCDDKTVRVKLLKRALTSADVGDVTLQAIACVIRAALLAEGEYTREEYLAKAEWVIGRLPALGKERIAALRNQADCPRPPLELAKILLPFNFR